MKDCPTPLATLYLFRYRSLLLLLQLNNSDPLDPELTFLEL